MLSGLDAPPAENIPAKILPTYRILLASALWISETIGPSGFSLTAQICFKPDGRAFLARPLIHIGSQVFRMEKGDIKAVKTPDGARPELRRRVTLAFAEVIEACNLKIDELISPGVCYPITDKILARLTAHQRLSALRTIQTLTQKSSSHADHQP